MKENRLFFTPSVLTKTIRSFLGVMTVLSFLHHCAAAEDDRRPHEHFCSITLQVMKDPVVAADGHSYERSAILEHFQGGFGSRSPATGLLLPNQNLFDNQALKVMIMDWKPGRYGEPSELETRNAEEIAERVRGEFQRNAALLGASKGRNIVAFLGNTGAGKSTLVNWLAGKELAVSDNGEDYVLAHPEDRTAMVIGAGGNSETLYPKFIDVGDLRFFDLPGFNDTDGTERNLVNAAFIRQILLGAASVRVVMVAGQDQFTADRSASVRQMFNAINQLFVVGQDAQSFVGDGIFVATKITCTAQTAITDFLLRRTDACDKAALNEQLQSWIQRDSLCCMFHPFREAQNEGGRERILSRIKDTKPAKVLGLNVSVLYPPETKEPLERLFFSVLENAFNRNLSESLTTLANQECGIYDEVIAFYGSDTFWSRFGTSVQAEESAIELLKEFCVNPYHKALKRFEQENEGKRQEHIKILGIKGTERIEEIEKKFFSVLEGAFNRDLGVSLETLSDYQKAIDSYRLSAFWPTFGATASAQEDMIVLLKEFCKPHYQAALERFERENEGKRQEHIKTLEDRREERIKDIERRTDAKVAKVISSLVPPQEGSDFVFFDFGFHKDFYDQVCGPDSIRELAADVLEQDVVRRYYAGFISQHSHGQMMQWHQRFVKGDMDKIEGSIRAQAKRTEVLEAELEVLEAKLKVLEVKLKVVDHSAAMEKKKMDIILESTRAQWKKIRLLEQGYSAVSVFAGEVTLEMERQLKDAEALRQYKRDIIDILDSASSR